MGSGVGVGSGLGVGSGHGVGFSATGSEKLSLEGYDFRYILQFYFKGTEIKRLYQ